MTELSRRSLLAGTGAAIAAWPLRAAGDARNADLVVRGARLQLVDDRGDGDELDVIGIADQHLVKKRLAVRMEVTVDEARDDRHGASVDDFGAAADEAADCIA
jgi:hypothetical protein